jgi:lysophospholipase L1-like esterase
MNLPFKDGDLIVFTGDSITDCGRDRRDPASLGMGYVAMIARRLDRERTGLRFRNTGISGDRTADLQASWSADCIDIRPGWVSLLIGINNVWQEFQSGVPAMDSTVATECRKLLERVRTETSARLILCSPFLLHVDESMVRMRDWLDPKILALRQLALEYDAIWVDLDAAFLAAQQRHIPSYWAEDGVHPTAEGHALMAETWLSALSA